METAHLLMNVRDAFIITQRQRLQNIDVDLQPGHIAIIAARHNMLASGMTDAAIYETMRELANEAVRIVRNETATA